MKILSPQFPDPQLIKQLIILDQQEMVHSWSEGSWQSIDWSRHWLFLTQHHEVVQAFTLFHYLNGDDYAHMLKIVVAPSFRRQGLAQNLHLQAEARAKELQVQRFVLEVAENNPAIHFYQQLGYQHERLQARFYSDGQNAVLMRKELD